MPAVAPSPSAPLSPRQRRKEARPQELLAAALALFTEKGFAATRTEEVAARAGVSKGTLYLYYPSKEALFKAVVHEHMGAHIAQGRERLAAYEGTMEEALRLVMQGFWARAGDGPAGGISKIMVAEARNFPELTAFYFDEVIRPGRELLSAVLRRGVASGEFRPIPIEATVLVLISPVLQLAMLQHAFADHGLHKVPLRPDAVLEVQLELMLRGLLQPKTLAAPNKNPRKTA
ncbi:MAG TPA: TetR/AcrR family transcriptional regulator [Burkholderiaceae bacterium]